MNRFDLAIALVLTLVLGMGTGALLRGWVTPTFPEPFRQKEFGRLVYACYDKRGVMIGSFQPCHREQTTWAIYERR